MNPMPSPLRQTGVALITALVVVSIAAIVATWLLSAMNREIRRTGSVLHQEQAWQYALGAEAWAAARLRRDARESEYDALTEQWAMEVPPMPVDGGSIGGRLIDLQGRFNLNGLIDRDGAVDGLALERFRRLLGALELPPGLADAVIDWIDRDHEPFGPGGAEDDHYLTRNPPHLAANDLMADVSELRLVAGVDPDAWKRLEPHVTALPEPTAINVNTATPAVLTALGLPAGEAKALHERVSETPFRSIDEFLRDERVRRARPDGRGLDVRSGWFLLEVEVEIGQISQLYRMLLRRDGDGNVQTVQRSIAIP